MNDSIFTVGAPGVDVDAIVEQVRARVAEKKSRNEYADARIAQAERANLEHLRNDEDFLAFYLECLRDAVFVDVNDFEILERRAWFARGFAGLKRIIWKSLKFYTYRMWSQQNQVNGLLLSAVDSIESRYRDRTAALEARIDALEKKLGDSEK